MWCVSGAIWRQFYKGKAVRVALQDRVPEKHLVSLSLEMGPLCLGNAQSNWQH